MPGYLAAVDPTRKSRTSLHPVNPAEPTASAPAAQRPRRQTQHLLPSQPETIPADASYLPVQPKLAIGSANSPLEAEADRMAAQVLSSGPGTGPGIGAQPSAAALHRHAAPATGRHSAPKTEAPAIVHDALNSPGRPLDSAIRASLEPRFGASLAGVRLHTGPDSAAAARSINASAYTVGQDIFFAAGRYDPHSGEGRRLLAHELTHTIQQSGGNPGKRLSPAARGIYRDEADKKTGKPPTPQTETSKPKADQFTLPMPPMLLQHFQLTPPSLLAPPGQQSSFTAPDYTHPLTGGAGASALGHPGASLFQPPSQFTPSPNLGLPPSTQYTPYGPSPGIPPTSPGVAVPPTPQAGGSSAIAPKAPDRIPFKSWDTFSVGVRFGFPDLTKDFKSGDATSALQAAIARTEVLNYMFTGQVPSAYSLDAGKLIGVSWSLFSTYIAKDFATKLANSLSSKPSTGGLSWTLDATILFKPPSGSGAAATPMEKGGAATMTLIF